MTCVLASLLLQTSTPTLSGFYTGLPGLASTRGLSLSIESHSAVVTLYHRTASTQSVTVIKNRSSSGATVTLAIPNVVRRAGTMGAAQGADIVASWDKKPIDVSTIRWTSRSTQNALVSADGYFTVSVKVNPGATHALRMSWQGDLMTSGMAGKSRTLAYDLGRAGDWASIGQFKYSIQYSQLDGPNGQDRQTTPVFAVESTTPKSGWQIGSRGAYLGNLPNVQTIWFTYHPNGYGS